MLLHPCPLLCCQTLLRLLNILLHFIELFIILLLKFLVLVQDISFLPESCFLLAFAVTVVDDPFTLIEFVEPVSVQAHHRIGGFDCLVDLVGPVGSFEVWRGTRGSMTWHNTLWDLDIVTCSRSLLLKLLLNLFLFFDPLREFGIGLIQRLPSHLLAFVFVVGDLATAYDKPFPNEVILVDIHICISNLKSNSNQK